MTDQKQELMAAQSPDPIAQFDQTLMQLAKSKTDVATIREMMAMRKEYQAEEARKAFDRAMTAFKAEPISVRKSKTVGYKTSDGELVGYTHAELADFTEAIGPAMSKHGLAYTWSSRKEGTQVFVTCRVRHDDGHFEETTLDSPVDTSGKKNAIQALGSTITYLQRYTLMMAAGVAARGMDDDGVGSGEETSAHPQQEAIDDLFAKIGLAETLSELQKLKPQILEIEAVQRRNLMGAYNKGLHKFGLVKPKDAP